MKIYDCLVRLSGNVHHEVPMFGVTVKEIAILRHIHGDDSVVKIKNSKQAEVKRTDATEIGRLAESYGEKNVKDVFNVSLSSLEDIVIDDDDDGDVVLAKEPEPEPAELAEPAPEPEPEPVKGDVEVKKSTGKKLD